MPIRVTFADGESLSLDVDIDQWTKAFKRALARNMVLEIENDFGEILQINPDRVLYVRQVHQGDSAERPELAAS